jgi:hypothetical protein
MLCHGTNSFFNTHKENINCKYEWYPLNLKKNTKRKNKLKKRRKKEKKTKQFHDLDLLRKKHLTGSDVM